jgi:hypothetical protein
MFVHICVMNISVQSRSFSNEVVVFLELCLSLSLSTRLYVLDWILIV